MNKPVDSKWKDDIFTRNGNFHLPPRYWKSIIQSNKYKESIMCYVLQHDNGIKKGDAQFTDFQRHYKRAIQVIEKKFMGKTESVLTCDLSDKVLDGGKSGSFKYIMKKLEDIPKPTIWSEYLKAQDSRTINDRSIDHSSSSTSPISTEIIPIVGSEEEVKMDVGSNSIEYLDLSCLDGDVYI
jgi:hypothetical protein